MNAACSPAFLRASGGDSACRKALKESIWVASRNGTGRTLARLAKLLRMRFLSVNEYVMGLLHSTGTKGKTRRQAIAVVTP